LGNIEKAGSFMRFFSFTFSKFLSALSKTLWGDAEVKLRNSSATQFRSGYANSIDGRDQGLRKSERSELALEGSNIHNRITTVL
jgi:hypothetical protein